MNDEVAEGGACAAASGDAGVGLLPACAGVGGAVDAEAASGGDDGAVGQSGEVADLVPVGLEDFVDADGGETGVGLTPGSAVVGGADEAFSAIGGAADAVAPGA